VRLDPTFPPTEVPALSPTLAPAPSPEVSPGAVAMAFAVGERARAEGAPPSPIEEPTNYLVRGEVAVEEDDRGFLLDLAESTAAAMAAGDAAVRIFADPTVECCPVCGGSPPVGTEGDVERLLCVERLRSLGMDGSGVMVAVVDTGVNMEYLSRRGKNPRFDAALSWAPASGGIPGQQPIGHGTMCAYDVCIAAPNCTLLDYSVLRSRRPGQSAMEGLLSDAVFAYSRLRDLLRAPQRPGELRSLVVTNSWGMYHPSWDFPVGHPGNYSDNPDHPFNRIVGSLERDGADLLFAAGNCGRECPSGKCGGITARAIYGANSHPQVICVGGVDVTGTRVGYSSIGPGRLADQKPDVCGFTHFKGSGVYPADGGTSAATPVVAGLLAALRTRRPSNPQDPTSSPAAFRELLRRTALDRSLVGFDYEYGWGIVNGCRLSGMVRPAPITDTVSVAVEFLAREMLAAG
jgi:subtilisin family serine protease